MRVDSNASDEALYSVFTEALETHLVSSISAFDPALVSNSLEKISTSRILRERERDRERERERGREGGREGGRKFKSVLQSSLSCGHEDQV